MVSLPQSCRRCGAPIHNYAGVCSTPGCKGFAEDATQRFHAPTLRRMIEMLDGDAPRVEKLQRTAPTRYAANYWEGHCDALRAFRERLEREAEKAA